MARCFALLLHSGILILRICMSRSRISNKAEGGDTGTGRSRRAGRRVSFRIQRLEPQIAMALGASTVWAGVILHPSVLEVWLMALAAVGIASWARAYPADRLSMMFLRAVLLLLGALLLHTASELDGPASLWLLWPLVVATGYSLLLPTTWAMSLALLALLEFIVACVLAQPPWQLAFAMAGALWFVPAMARAFGRSVRFSVAKAEQSQVDQRTQLYNEDGFFAIGAELFDECRRAKRPFSLILLSGSNLRDASDLLGKKAAISLFGQMVRGISAIASTGSLAARTDAVEFGLVLPGTTSERAQELLHQKLGDPPKLGIELGGEQVTIILDAVIAQAPPDVHSLEELYDRLRLRLREQTSPDSKTSGEPSTLQGLLLGEAPMPHSARPTLPMSLKPLR